MDHACGRTPRCALLCAESGPQREKLIGGTAGTCLHLSQMTKVVMGLHSMAPVEYSDRSYVYFEVEDEKLGAVIRALDGIIDGEHLSMGPVANKKFEIEFTCFDEKLEIVFHALKGIVSREAISVTLTGTTTG
jgi:hypothetical protein